MNDILDEVDALVAKVDGFTAKTVSDMQTERRLLKDRLRRVDTALGELDRVGLVLRRMLPPEGPPTEAEWRSRQASRRQGDGGEKGNGT